MNVNLLKYIQLLTESDKKSLSQKALKACEEVGELAKVVLPFENAHACNHRFVDKQKILEEIADTYLVIQSIAFELGFTYEDFESKVAEKTKKWHELHQREEKYDKLPYEIHITVNMKDLDNFKEVCKSLNVKPIILDLQNQEGSYVMMDVMTSSVHIGNNRSAFEEMKRISKGMNDAGFNIVREKIETVPWHPSAPSKEHAEPIMPKDCYFETHFGVVCSDKRKDLLSRIAKQTDCHLSRNIFKKLTGDTYMIMMTHRRYEGTREEFEDTVASIKSTLESKSFQIEKEIVEFSVYDTKINHDSSWLNTDEVSALKS